MKNLSKIAILLLGGAALLPASQLITLTGSLSATADFQFSNGSVTVTLTNTTPTKNAANLLTDFMFQLSNPAGGTVPVTVSSPVTGTGHLVNVDDNGSVVDYTGGQNPAWGFGVYHDSGLPAYNGLYLVCTVCGAGVQAPYQPSEGVLGPGTGSGTTPYSTANASIKNNTPHNPYFLNSVAFTFNGQDITTSTKAANVYFSFGTQWGTEIPGGTTITGGEVPEPITFLLTGTALLGVGIVSRRRRGTRSKQ
jgi:hypothetical protein